MAYGCLVAAHTLAVHHDHFFNFRLDLDVDSPQNSLLIEALTPVKLSQESPRRSTWILKSTDACNGARSEAALHDGQACAVARHQSQRKGTAWPLRSATNSFPNMLLCRC